MSAAWPVLCGRAAKSGHELTDFQVGHRRARRIFERARLSTLLRWVTYLVILAGAAALYAGYNPPLVATYWPAAAPLAQQIHGYLPAALTGAPAAPTAPPAVPSRPPVSV